jgi:Ca2+-binding RTX toxin-like protein
LVTASLVLGAPASARDVINGTGGDDQLRGTPFSDTIRGFAGRDSVVALAGRDLIYGGSGFDGIVAVAVTTPATAAPVCRFRAS